LCVAIFLNVIFECFISGFYISKGTTHKGSCYMCADFCINIYMHGFFHHVFLAHLASRKLSSLWLKLKQQWTFEEIIIFSNISHLEWRAELSMHGFFHHVFLAHLACLWPGELLPSLGIRRPLAVVRRKLSHLNLLLGPHTRYTRSNHHSMLRL
jgi:hypothetical protein